MTQDQLSASISTILEDMSHGIVPWQKTWNSYSGLPIRGNGKGYQGINVIILLSKGYCQPRWLTYKQASELGGHVRKGERGTTVFYSSSITVKNKEGTTDTTSDTTSDETSGGKQIFFMKSYTVFNVLQCDNLPEKLFINNNNSSTNSNNPRLENAETLVANTGAVIDERSGLSPKYHLLSDTISMPLYSEFDNRESYYATLLHELIHWTGAKHRLDRIKSTLFGSNEYAFEELVAELGASLLCSQLNIRPFNHPETIGYLQSWHRILKADPKFLFRAAALAQKAIAFIHPTAEAEVEADALASA
jgi:antirestriction protein ArdC